MVSKYSLTANELVAHKEKFPNNLLIVVRSVELDRGKSSPVAGEQLLDAAPGSRAPRL